MSKLKIDVSGQLAKYNKANGTSLTINGLHKEVGITRQTLGNWENGDGLKTLEAIYTLAKFLNVPMETLIIKSKKKN